MLEGLFDNTNYQAAKKLMDVSMLRHEAIAGNIANANTPGYRRVQIDSSFDKQLLQAVKEENTSKIRDLQAEIKVDRNPNMIREDGNTVEIDKEMVDMNRNALEVEFLSQYLTGRYKSMRTAISGNI